MASIEFPLLQKQTPFGMVSDPRIPIIVHTVSGDVTFRFLVDTGADFSLAPRRLAQQTGLEWQALPGANVSGVGPGAMPARLGPLALRIGSVELTVRRLFADVPAALFILGRADFLDRFRLSVDTRLSRITLSD